MHTSKYRESKQLMTQQGMHVAPGRSPSTQSGNATNASILLLVQLTSSQSWSSQGLRGSLALAQSPASPGHDPDHPRRRAGDAASPPTTRGQTSPTTRQGGRPFAGEPAQETDLRCHPGSQSSRGGDHNRRLPVCPPHAQEAAITWLAPPEDSRPHGTSVSGIPGLGTGWSARKPSTIPRSGAAPPRGRPHERARARIIYGRPVRHVTGARAQGRARHPAPPPAWDFPPLARPSAAQTTQDGSRLCQPQPGRAEPSPSSHHAPTRKMDGPYFEAAPPQAKANVNTGLLLWKFVIKPIHHPAAQIFSFLFWLLLYPWELNRQCKLAATLFLFTCQRMVSKC